MARAEREKWELKSKRHPTPRLSSSSSGTLTRQPSFPEHVRATSHGESRRARRASPTTSAPARTATKSLSSSRVSSRSSAIPSCVLCEKLLRRNPSLLTNPLAAAAGSDEGGIGRSSTTMRSNASGMDEDLLEVMQKSGRPCCRARALAVSAAVNVFGVKPMHSQRVSSTGATVKSRSNDTSPAGQAA